MLFHGPQTLCQMRPVTQYLYTALASSTCSVRQETRTGCSGSLHRHQLAIGNSSRENAAPLTATSSTMCVE